MAMVPKATPNNNPYHENDTAVDLVKPKSEVVREAGFTPKRKGYQPAIAVSPIWIAVCCCVLTLPSLPSR